MFLLTTYITIYTRRKKLVKQHKKSNSICSRTRHFKKINQSQTLIEAKLFYSTLNKYTLSLL